MLTVPMHSQPEYVNGADALTTWMCKRCRCIHKLNKPPKNIYVKYMSTSTPFMHALTPEKNCLILIVLLSIDNYRSFSSAASIFFTLVTQKMSSGMQKFIDLWTDKNQTGDNALVQSKVTNTIYINSIRIIQMYWQFFLSHGSYW